MLQSLVVPPEDDEEEEEETPGETGNEQTATDNTQTEEGTLPSRKQRKKVKQA